MLSFMPQIALLSYSFLEKCARRDSNPEPSDP
jgi:hypothetical protein